MTKTMAHQLTKTEQECLDHVHKMSKGWPVGIPAEKETAQTLVQEGFAYWAPPAWIHQQDLFCIALTSKGKVYLTEQNHDK